MGIRTSYVRITEMDLSSGAREFHDVEDDETEDQEYKGMTFGQKVLYKVKNW